CLEFWCVLFKFSTHFFSFRFFYFTERKYFLLFPVRFSQDIIQNTNYSYYDCLIMASALKNGCSIVYTEDMNDGQVIENLKIINPY
ncbi:MAG: hypothetical protein PHC34_11575, partial [Candidatus Gastranaerophilales bacterium]|nr:hypothetical protein [Candidatus Gastranaerophilales bacterium]